MLTLPRSLDLTEKQCAFFNLLISHYKNKNVLSAQLVFIKDATYVPYMLKHGGVYENLEPKDFLLTLSSYSSSLIEHDGAVFIYPNGKVVFGAIIDPLLFANTVPSKISEYGAARALLRLITQDSENSIYCGLKCGKNLALFYKGEKQLLHKSRIKLSNHIHNYGIGLVVSDSLPMHENTQFIKMGCYKKIHTKDVSDVASCIASICHNPKHHDGFWVYSPTKMTISGPYLVLVKVIPEHAQNNEGLKRLTASLISHYLDIPVLLLRENSNKFMVYGMDSCDITLELQKHFDVFAGYITSDALVA